MVYSREVKGFYQKVFIKRFLSKGFYQMFLFKVFFIHPFKALATIIEDNASNHTQS
jgi:hypothetical protein